MVIVTILGSPRRHGNTAAVLQAFEDLVAPRHQVERINITDYRIGGCRSCYACHRTPEVPGCIQQDDAIGLLEKIVAADAVVYASPVYCWAFPSELKALMDRQFCLRKPGAGEKATPLAGKRMALLITCGGDAGRNSELILPMFDREAEFLGAVVAGKYVVANTTHNASDLGERAAETARRMAEEIPGD